MSRLKSRTAKSCAGNSCVGIIVLKELLPEKKHDRKLRESVGKLDVVKKELD